MGQLSIIFIVGFICLFAYDLPESVEAFDLVHSLFWHSLLTLIPILFALVLTHIVPLFIKFITHIVRLFIKSDRPFVRYVIDRIGSLRFVFEILCLATYLCNLYIFDLPIYINIQFSFFPFFELRQSFALFPLLISLIGVRLVFHHINRSDDVRYSELLSFHIKFLLLPLIPLLIYLTTLDILVRLPEEDTGVFGRTSVSTNRITLTSPCWCIHFCTVTDAVYVENKTTNRCFPTR